MARQPTPNKGVEITHKPDAHAPTYLVLERPHERSGSPICSLPCLAAWARWSLEPLILGYLPITSRTCTHCVICAVAVHRPTDCRLHESCPPYLWAGTLTARPILAALARLNEGRPVTDVQIRLATEIARLCPDLLPLEVANRVRRAKLSAPGPGRG